MKFICLGKVSIFLTLMMGFSQTLPARLRVDDVRTEFRNELRKTAAAIGPEGDSPQTSPDLQVLLEKMKAYGKPVEFPEEATAMVVGLLRSSSEPRRLLGIQLASRDEAPGKYLASEGLTPFTRGRLMGELVAYAQSNEATFRYLFAEFEAGDFEFQRLFLVKLQPLLAARYLEIYKWLKRQIENHPDPKIRIQAIRCLTRAGREDRPHEADYIMGRLEFERDEDVQNSMFLYLMGHQSSPKVVAFFRARLPFSFNNETVQETAYRYVARASLKNRELMDELLAMIFLSESMKTDTAREILFGFEDVLDEGGMRVPFEFFEELNRFVLQIPDLENSLSYPPARRTIAKILKGDLIKK
jgi:hypothetical protein